MQNRCAVGCCSNMSNVIYIKKAISLQLMHSRQEARSDQDTSLTVPSCALKQTLNTNQRVSVCYTFCKGRSHWVFIAIKTAFAYGQNLYGCDSEKTQIPNTADDLNLSARGMIWMHISNANFIIQLVTCNKYGGIYITNLYTYYVKKEAYLIQSIDAKGWLTQV